MNTKDSLEAERYEQNMKWFKETYAEKFRDLSSVSDWKVLKAAVTYRKLTGDIDGAIEAMVTAIGIMRASPNLIEEMAESLHYLAAELYRSKNAMEQAEVTMREAIELSRSLRSSHLADNLQVLASMLTQQGVYGEARASAEEARQLYQQQGHSYGVAQAEELIKRIMSMELIAKVHELEFGVAPDASAMEEIAGNGELPNWLASMLQGIIDDKEVECEFRYDDEGDSLFDAHELLGWKYENTGEDALLEFPRIGKWLYVTREAILSDGSGGCRAKVARKDLGLRWW